MLSFEGMSRQELEQCLLSMGEARVHSKVVFKKLYPKLVSSHNLPSQLPKSLEKYIPTELGASLSVRTASISSYDHSVKFVFALDDDSLIETVLMPEKTRLTVCLSSQVGCRQACSFCHTGKLGLSRNLKCHEIVAQVQKINQWIVDNPQWKEGLSLPSAELTNIVFMGMGEPLDNFEELARAVRVFQDPYGYGFASKRITISTAGLLSGLQQLFASDLNVSLALSLHAGNPSKRKRLMPIERKSPLSQVLPLLKKYTQKSRKKIFIQYTLISGFNDSIEDAKSLIDSLEGLAVKINLIPFNDVEGLKFEAPDASKIKEFQTYLLDKGFRTMVRYSKGQDIVAACGQLAAKSS